MASTTDLISPPRFFRFASFEFMAELRASPLRFRDWLRPSSLRTESGDWLAWCGPLHVAVSRV